MLEVPQEKIDSIHSVIYCIRNDTAQVSARQIASFVGKVISLSIALGIICQLMTRHLSMALCNRKGWDCVFEMSKGCD